MSLVLIALNIGLILFLLSAGLTLVFGMLGVVNLAHGAFYMFGGYIAWQLTQSFGGFPLAIVAVVLAMGLLGGAIERLLLRPLYLRSHADQLLLTFGLVLVLEESVRLIWGLDFRNVPTPAMFSGWIELAGSRIGIYRFVVCGIGFAVAATLVLILEKTLIGARMRAAAENPRMLSCMGTDVERLRFEVFILGAALAGLAGVLAAPLSVIESTMASQIIIDCFFIIVIGGMGNVRGAIAGALLLGFIRAFGQQYAPAWIDFAMYGLLLGVLLFKPQGLFGKSVRSA